MNISIKVMAVAVCGMLLGGCVTSSTYQAKEMESQQLSRKLDETKNSYGELKEKFVKLEEANNEQTAKLNRLSSEAAELRQENTRLVSVNGEQNAGLKKTAAEAEEIRLENTRFAETIKKQSENLKTISAEFVELKLENAKLAESLQPENILKTLADIFAAQKQKIKALTEENTKLKVRIVTQPAIPPAESRFDKAPVDKVQKPVSPAVPVKKELEAEPADKVPVKNTEGVITPAPAPAKPELTPEPAENDSEDENVTGQTAIPPK